MFPNIDFTQFLVWITNHAFGVIVIGGLVLFAAAWSLIDQVIEGVSGTSSQDNDDD